MILFQCCETVKQVFFNLISLHGYMSIIVTITTHKEYPNLITMA